MDRTTLLKTLAGAAVGALLAFGMLALFSSQKAEPLPADLQGVVLDAPKPLGQFQLTAGNGKPLGPDEMRGHWTFLFFGYTHCPDICPTTLLTLQRVRKDLDSTPALAKETRFLFVSVDPKRDTPAKLDQYVHFFGQDFVGATGDKAQIDHLVKIAGAVYVFDGDTSGDNYIVNHSASLYLIDPQGRLYARLSPPLTEKEVATLYRSVRHYYGDYPKG